MDTQKTIEIIMTGGTIDSYWDAPKDTTSPNQHSAIPKYVASLHLSSQIISTEICMKDSRALTPEDLNQVIEAIEKSTASLIIVTHGTYTMPDSAKFIEARLKRKDQTVILTGSMVPLEGFSPSDAAFNLGFAIAKVQDLPKGVYLCMNGDVFSPSEVAKNILEGKFYSIFRQKDQKSIQ